MRQTVVKPADYHFGSDIFLPIDVSEAPPLLILRYTAATRHFSLPRERKDYSQSSISRCLAALQGVGSSACT